MPDAGDIHLANLNEELRRHVLVISSARFNRAAERVLVAPEVLGEPDEVPDPWRVDIDGSVFAIDHLRSLGTGRLLERTGRASHTTMARIRRIILTIT